MTEKIMPGKCLDLPQLILSIETLKKGLFSVQMSDTNRFGCRWIDQALEVTVNKPRHPDSLGNNKVQSATWGSSTILHFCREQEYLSTTTSESFSRVSQCY